MSLQELNLEKADQEVWLVKIPPSLAKAIQSMPVGDHMFEFGRLQAGEGSQKTVKLNDEVFQGVVSEYSLQELTDTITKASSEKKVKPPPRRIFSVDTGKAGSSGGGGGGGSSSSSSSSSSGGSSSSSRPSVAMEGVVGQTFALRPLRTAAYSKTLAHRTAESRKKSRTQIVRTGDGGFQRQVVATRTMAIDDRPRHNVQRGGIKIDEADLRAAAEAQQKKKAGGGGGGSGAGGAGGDGLVALGGGDRKRKRAPTSTSGLRKAIFAAFEKEGMWTKKDLEVHLGARRTQISQVKELLSELCVYHKVGEFSKHYELKPEYQSTAAPAAESAVAPPAGT